MIDRTNSNSNNSNNCNLLPRLYYDFRNRSHPVWTITVVHALSPTRRHLQTGSVRPQLNFNTFNII